MGTGTGQGWTLKLDKVYDHVSSINGCNVVLLGDTWGYAWYLVVQENVILYSYLYIIHFEEMKNLLIHNCIWVPTQKS